jgi:hypothetical protein
VGLLDGNARLAKLIKPSPFGGVYNVSKNQEMAENGTVTARVKGLEQPDEIL